MDDGLEGLEVSSWCHHFVVIDTLSLGKAFSYILHFVADDLSSVVTFAFADKLPFKRAFSLW